MVGYDGWSCDGGKRDTAASVQRERSSRQPRAERFETGEQSSLRVYLAVRWVGALLLGCGVILFGEYSPPSHTLHVCDFGFMHTYTHPYVSGALAS